MIEQKLLNNRKQDQKLRIKSTNNGLLIAEDQNQKQQSQCMTIDSPIRKVQRLNKFNQTNFNKTQTLLMKNFFSHAQNQKIWEQSATSMRRQTSPAFRFSRGRRFSSVENDQKRNRLILKLKIGNQISSVQKGISFAKSQRSQHFKPKRQRQDQPSPASYYSNIIPQTSKITIKDMIRIKPSSACGFRGSKTVMKLSSDFITPDTIKGITIPKFQKTNKIFLHHGQNLPYQPEVTMNNPGVGKYNVNYGQFSIKQKKSFIGQALKKFNQFVGQNPGPGAYGKQGQMVAGRSKSANHKGTLALSKRTYLVDKNLQDYSPAPNSYKIKRFLQN